MNYEIMVSEPWDFKALDGENKILVSGLGIVNVGDHNGQLKKMFLLQVLHPFIIDKQKVEFLVCQPRYDGDTIHEISKTSGIVGVYRVREESLVQKEQKISANDIIYFVTGSLKFISE